MGGKGLGSAMLMVAALIWGTALVAQRLGMEHCGPLAFNAARFGLGGIVTGLALLLRAARAQRPKAAERAERNANRALLLRGGLWCGAVLFLTASLQQYGICFTSVGKAGFITSLYLVLVPLLGLFLGKKIALGLWLCIAGAVVGMYLLCLSGAGPALSQNPGDGLMLLCALSTAAHILLVGRFAPLVDGVALSCLQFVVCALCSALAAALWEQPGTEAFLAWKALLYTGILSCGLAYTLQTLGQATVPPGLCALLLSLEAVFAAVAGWLVLGEALSPRESAGCALIFAAIAAAQAPGVGHSGSAQERGDGTLGKT